MSEKNLDRNGRWRNITVAFRVSPEEDKLIESAVRMAGLTKQDYIINNQCPKVQMHIVVYFFQNICIFL